MIRKLLTGAAALSMVATPVMAQPAANPAAKLSLSKAVPANARAANSQAKSKALGGGLIVAIVAAAAVVAGIVIVAEDSDSN